jgi:DNA-binding GntR family transcriptional regulator
MEIKNVKTSVLEYLREKIVAGELKAGQKLNENHIASQLDISRHPLREAFRILENDRLVMSIDRRGVYVTDLSIDDLEQLYWAREMTEVYAIDSLRAQKIRSLPKALSSLDHTSSLSEPNGDNLEQRIGYLKAMADFHSKLVESAGNKFLSGFYFSTYFHLLRYQFICSYMPGSSHRSLKEHRQILALIEAGAYDRAKKLVKDHLSYTLAFLRETLSDMGLRGNGFQKG